MILRMLPILVGAIFISRMYCSRLTLMRWKLTLQLAPAREGIKRSPCLLGEDRGELEGVRACIAPKDFCTKKVEGRHYYWPGTKHPTSHWTVTRKLNNKTGGDLGQQMAHLFEVLTTEGNIHKNLVIWLVRSCFHSTLVTLLNETETVLLNR